MITDAQGAADQRAHDEWQDGEGADCLTTTGYWHAALAWERARVAAERLRPAHPATSPRPWKWLPDDGQFIVDANGNTVAEIPCQGCKPGDGELIVHAVNTISPTA